MDEFRSATRAITKAGQIKGGIRHEKDDRLRIDDRSRYVLGWSNERKIDALLSRATALAERMAAVDAQRARHEAAMKAAVVRGQVLAGLAETSEFTDIDYQSAVNRIEELKDEHRKLKAASAELSRLDAELEAVREQIRQIDGADGERSEVDGRLGGIKNAVSQAESARREAQAVLTEPACGARPGAFRAGPGPARQGRARAAGYVRRVRQGRGNRGAGDHGHRRAAR